MENGILQLTISKPAGHVTGIKCYDIDNLVEVRNKEDNRGYMTLYTLLFLVFAIQSTIKELSKVIFKLKYRCNFWKSHLNDFNINLGTGILFGAKQGVLEQLENLNCMSNISIILLVPHYLS